MVRAGLVLATSGFEARALATRPRGLPAQWSKDKSHFHHFYAFYGKMNRVKFRVYIFPYFASAKPLASIYNVPT